MRVAVVVGKEKLGLPPEFPRVGSAFVRLKDSSTTELVVARDRVRDSKARLGIQGV
jgi:hypothetical protein